MKIIKFVVVLIFSMQFLNGFSYENDPLRKQLGSYRNYYDIKGSIENNLYIQQNNLFSFKVPYLLKPGARISDNFNKSAGNVSFMDDLGKLIRIDYIKTSRFPNISQERLINDVDKLLYGAFYKPTEANLNIKIKLIHKETKSKKTFAIFDLPRGSSVFENKERVDAIRGTIAFIANDYLFLITKQSRDTTLNQRKKTSYNDINNMINSLKDLYKDFNSINN